MQNVGGLLKSKTILLLAIFVVLLFIVMIFFYVKPAKEVSETKSVPAQSTSSEGFTFIAFGDSRGGSKEQKTLAKLMKEVVPNVVIHTGDLTSKGTSQEINEDVLELYKGVFSFDKFYPSLGNHDYATKKGEPFIETFELPGNERYYYFHEGDTLFIALDTNDPLNEEPNEMIPWRRKTLAVQGKKATWIVGYFHHPPYSSGASHGSDLRVREKIVPILEKYNVDVVFTGHDHNYQRTCEILNNTCVQNGVLYIVTAGGGAPLYSVGEESWFVHTQFSAYHFIEGKVDNCNLVLVAIDINNEVIDSVSLSKCSS